MNIDIIVPVLGRPEHADTFIESLDISYSPTQHTVHVLAMVEQMGANDYNAWAHHDAAVLTKAHTFSQKANAGYRLLDDTDGDWVLLVGSDVKFHEGWIRELELALSYMPQACVLGTLDLLNGATHTGRHTCHPVIKRSYIDEVGASWDGPGVVCSEAYHHNFVDNEICTAAIQRGVWTPTFATIEHLHPVAGKAEWDEVYREGETWKTLDSLTWAKRLRANSPSPSG